MTRAAFATFRCGFFGVVHRLFSIGGTFSYIGRKEILFKKMFEIKKTQNIRVVIGAGTQYTSKKTTATFPKTNFGSVSSHPCNNNKYQRKSFPRVICSSNSQNTQPRNTRSDLFFA
jgi:hypothetical protein